MNLINLNKLYYFYVVAQTGSVKAATQALHLSQSTISGQIKDLEEELGYDLFLRRHRRLDVSVRGQEVLKKAERLFSIAASISDTSAHEHTKTQVKIGVLPSVGALFIYEFSMKLWTDRKIIVSTTSGTIEQLKELLDTEKIDLILSDGASLHGTHYRTLPVFSETLVAVTRDTSEFKTNNFPQNLAGKNYIKVAQPSTFQSDIDHLLRLQNIRPIVTGEAHDIELVRAILKETNSFSILPKTSVQNDIKQKELKIIGEFKKPPLTINAILPSISNNQKLVKKILKDYFMRNKK